MDPGVPEERKFHACFFHSFSIGKHLIRSPFLYYFPIHHYCNAVSHHSLIHTTAGIIPCLDKVSVLAGKYGGYFLRSHASYLINPSYMLSLKRFSLTLTDGTTLPVPEKKYTAFKRALNDWTRQTE